MMSTQNLAPTPPKRAGKLRLLGLGAGIALAAVVVVVLLTSRRENAPMTPTAGVVQQMGLDAPEWTLRPQKSPVVPVDTSAMDPASQGILRYIQVHDDIPDYIILDLYERQRNDPD